VSKESAKANRAGPGTEWRDELDGYTVSLVEVSADADLTELLKGLPGDACPSPHWGYVLKGRTWFRSTDREESFGPGDAFYLALGHTSRLAIAVPRGPVGAIREHGEPGDGAEDSIFALRNS
jgi:hypothetical protein